MRDVVPFALHEPALVLVPVLLLPLGHCPTLICARKHRLGRKGELWCSD